MSRNTLVTIGFLLGLVVCVVLNQSYIIHWTIFAGWIALYLFISTLGACILAMQFFIPARCKGSETSNSIAITFDDGPLPDNTHRVLSILDQYQIKATFFCIGYRVKKNPAILKDIDKRGHLIGNHSYLHGKTFDLQSGSAIENELKDTDEIIRNTIGHTPRFFRPPYGVTNPMVAKAVRNRKQVVVGWSIRSFDTVTRDSDKLLKRVTKSVKGGDIVLFHDYSESMIRILPAFIEHIKNLGLKVVRVDELLNEKGYE